MSYLDLCRDAGLVAFRGTERGRIYRPAAAAGNSRLRRAARLIDAYASISGSNASEPPERSGMIELRSSRFLPALLAGARASRLAACPQDHGCDGAAARTESQFHLWWHPHNFGASTEKNLDVLSVILRTFQEFRESHGMESLTMAEAAAEAAT